MHTHTDTHTHTQVFINVCEHEEVPATDKKRSHKRWPLFVLGAHFRRSVDKNAEECGVLDVGVHPSVMQECTADKTGEAKEEVSVKVIDALRNREKLIGGPMSDGGPLDKTFSMPRLSKRYKGDIVVEMHIPSSIHIDKKSQSLFDVS
jgi:hypothetical protein